MVTEKINYKIESEAEKAVRLNKFMCNAGFCSRREADRLISEGKVLVNGETAGLGQKVKVNDIVECDGRIINKKKHMILLAFNKPEGIECTSAKDNPDNIIDYINYPERIFPIGRLDKNSNGLILLTNEGELSNQILKASNHHEKEYVVRTDKAFDDEFLEKMSAGVKLDKREGEKEFNRITRPCVVRRINERTFDIILTQGLNRQIRRMCKALGYSVVSLKRIRVMNILLGDLKSGEYRSVTDEEITELYKQLKDKNGSR